VFTRTLEIDHGGNIVLGAYAHEGDFVIETLAL
jgi:hypothetical protein